MNRQLMKERPATEHSTDEQLDDTETALSVRGLGKRFGERVAFEDLSFEVGWGEVFGFLGPNGAGKTSTVRTLGPLIGPTENLECFADGAAGLLIALNAIGWRVASATFDRERLILGTR